MHVGGGLTYELIMNSVKPQLEEYCNPVDDTLNASAANLTEAEASDDYKRVEFDWYFEAVCPNSLECETLCHSENQPSTTCSHHYHASQVPPTL